MITDSNGNIIVSDIENNNEMQYIPKEQLQEMYEKEQSYEQEYDLEWQSELKSNNDLEIDLENENTNKAQKENTKEENSNDTQDIANIKDNKSKIKEEQNNNILSEHEKDNNIIYEEIEQTNDLQDSKTISTISLLKENIEKRESLDEQELISINAINMFKKNYKDINDFLEMNNENTQQKENPNEKDSNNKESNKKNNAEELDETSNSIDKELDDLDKALENLVKAHSLADFIRALYILDKALYQMGKAKEKPNEKPIMKEMLDNLEKGKPLTKELASKALKDMKDSKNMLDDFILQREKELNNKNALESAMKKYNNSISTQQKEAYITNINDRIEHINKNLPSFKNNENKTFKKAVEMIKNHERQITNKKQNILGFMGLNREK